MPYTIDNIVPNGVPYKMPNIATNTRLGGIINRSPNRIEK